MNDRCLPKGRVVIRITVDKAEPLTGVATTGSGDALPFEGWLGLLGVLSQLVVSRLD